MNSNEDILYSAEWSHNVNSVSAYKWYVGSYPPYFLLPPTGILFRFIPFITMPIWIITLSQSNEFDSTLYIFWSAMSSFFSSELAPFKTHLTMWWAPHLQVNWTYYLAFAAVLIGLIIYSTTYALIPIMLNPVLNPFNSFCAWIHACNGKLFRHSF